MTKTWIGGGHNLASDPEDWSPAGVPLNEDAVISHGIMIIPGSTLAGSNNLDVRGGDVTLFINGVGGNSTAEVRPIHVESGLATIQVSAASALFNLVERADASVAIRLSGNTKWTGNFQLSGNADIGGFGTFIPAGGFSTISADRSEPAPRVTIDANIAAGSGIDDRGGFLKIGGSVAAGENIGAFSGEVTIERPHLFSGQVELGSAGLVDLIGLAQAESYSFQNDLLSIYSAGKVIDTLLFNRASQDFGVAKTITGGVVIYAPDHQPRGSIPLHNIDFH